VVLVSGFFFFRWRTQNKWNLASYVEGYLQPWKAAISLALLGTLSYLLVGMPFGITTAYAKAAAYLTKIVAPAHVAETPFYNAVPLNYAAPISHVQLLGGAGPVVDAITYIQFPLIVGIILGAMIAALQASFLPWDQE